MKAVRSSDSYRRRIGARCPPGSSSSGLVNQTLPIVSRGRVSAVMLPGDARRCGDLRHGRGLRPRRRRIVHAHTHPTSRSAAPAPSGTPGGHAPRSPAAVMPPPRAAMTSALAEDTGPMLLENTPAATLKSRARQHEAALSRWVTSFGFSTRANRRYARQPGCPDGHLAPRRTGRSASGHERSPVVGQQVAELSTLSVRILMRSTAYSLLD